MADTSSAPSVGRAKRNEPMIYITHVRLGTEVPSEHHHITDIRWVNPSSTAADESPLGQIVDWINEGGDVWVREGIANHKVVVVNGASRHIRAVAHDTFTDHLLVLPRF